MSNGKILDYSDVSVVMPCLNEEDSIGMCISDIRALYPGIEVIVVDNGSYDCSVAVSRSRGAGVVFEQRRGYGSAYIKGFSEVKRSYIVMVDSDNTYDHRAMSIMIDLLRDSKYDFVIGDRFKGKIISMPWMNRYIGNPILSGMFRLLYNTSIHDIHCGLRAFTKDAYLKMNLKTQGMEFASEMVASAIKNNLLICEVPVNYYPRRGYSKLNPIKDALRHIVFMIKYRCKRFC